MEFDERPGGRHERKVFRLSLLGGLPAVVVSLALLIHGNYTAKVQWTLGVLIIVTWVIVAAMVVVIGVGGVWYLLGRDTGLVTGDILTQARFPASMTVLPDGTIRFAERLTGQIRDVSPAVFGLSVRCSGTKTSRTSICCS